jgi:hypothetical protein
MDALLPGEQIRELLVCGGALVIVEDRDLFHARVKDAPAGAQAGRHLFARVFFACGAAGAFVLGGFLRGIATTAVSEASASDCST